MKPYSKDLRLKVLDVVDSGMPRKEVARIFGISLPSIKRWLKRRRESGNVEPSPIPGPLARKGAILEEWLPGQLGSEPDLTLEEHCGAFEEALRAKVSTATMSRRISRLPGGWPLKNQGSHGARRGGRAPNRPGDQVRQRCEDHRVLPDRTKLGRGWGSGQSPL